MIGIRRMLSRQASGGGRPSPKRRNGTPCMRIHSGCYETPHQTRINSTDTLVLEWSRGLTVFELEFAENSLSRKSERYQANSADDKKNDVIFVRRRHIRSHTTFPLRTAPCMRDTVVRRCATFTLLSESCLKRRFSLLTYSLNPAQNDEKSLSKK